MARKDLLSKSKAQSAPKKQKRQTRAAKKVSIPEEKSMPIINSSGD